MRAGRLSVARPPTVPSSRQSAISRARGQAVTFYPFILMDVPPGNALPDPYGGTAQAPYPWRGRITRGIPRPASRARRTRPLPPPPRSPALSARRHRRISRSRGDDVIYTGPAEWSFRRMILHYAHLCVAAGGVETFLIGSELRGLTQAPLQRQHAIRSSPRSWRSPTTCAACSAPATKITYAADWSEYFGHQPADGTGDVYFHLDPLWASANIDAVGIDVYWPLSDWRDGDSHLDRLDRHREPARPRLPQAQHLRAARATAGTTPVMPRARRRRGPPSPMAPESPGCSATRTSATGGPTSTTTAPAGRERRADGLGSAVEADLDHRARLPGCRQGLQPAQRLLRSQKLRELPAALLARLPRRSHTTPLHPGVSRDLRSDARGLRARAQSRCRRSTGAGWSIPTASMCTPGTLDLIRPSRTISDAGPTAATGRSAIG